MQRVPNASAGRLSASAVALAALAALAAVVGGARPAHAFGPDPTTAATRFRFVVLNDVHLTVEDLGVSRAQLHAAVDEINAFAPEINFVLVAGDLAQSTDPAGLQIELQAARDELNRLAMPYHVAIGNHDVTLTGDDTAFRALFGPTSYRFQYGGMQFVCLRTVQTQNSITISGAALDSLQARLSEISTTSPLIVFAHHPLSPVAPLVVTNTGDFYSRVDPYNLKGVFTGHWHGVFEEQRLGAWYCTSAALAVHRTNDDDTFEKGYRLVTVMPDYSLASRFYALGHPPTFAPEPPQIAATGNRYALPGRTLRVTIAATDADGDAITYAAAGLPAGATFDPATRLLSWKPTAGQAGWYPNLQFSATAADGITVRKLGVRVLPSACVFDDFEPMQALWETYGGFWTVSNGTLVQSSSSNGGSYFDVVKGAWSDIYLEADVRHDGGSGYAGLVFRYVDQDNNYYVWSDGARLQVRKRVAGTATPVGGHVHVGSVAGWHHMRVEAVGANIKVFWDGAQRLDVNDATFASGGIGAVCSQATGAFDNVVLAGCGGLPNRAPVLQAVGDQTAYVGTPLLLQLSATDPDGAVPLAYSASGLPPGASFDAVQHRVTWTPTAVQAGPWLGTTFGVTDGELSDAETTAFSVFDPTATCMHEDFLTKDTNWTAAGGTWSTVAGEYQGTAGATPALSRYMMQPSENFTLQARIRVEGSGSGGVAFRAVDATHYDYLAFSPSLDLVELRKMNGAASVKLAGGAELFGDANTWHMCRIEGQGAHLRVWVDGVQQFDYTDTGATTGGRVYTAGMPGAFVQSGTLHLDEVLVSQCDNTVSDAGPDGATARVLRVTAAPNPFNPSTQIRLDLAHSTHARVVVLDVAGRRVRVIGEGEFAAGTHLLPWNGKGDGGRVLASGVYFVHVKTDDASQTHRVVMLK